MLALAVLVGACGGANDNPTIEGPPRGAGTSATPATTAAPKGACDPEVREPLDPGSAQHVLPGAPTPTYSTHPPTSGAHMPGKWPTGVLHGPIKEPVQVALLEGGEVLIQYKDGHGPTHTMVEVFTSHTKRVTSAPNPDLPGEVVATAWTYKLVCRRFDEASLQRFVDAHAGKGA